jgi:hypothetical protein
VVLSSISRRKKRKKRKGAREGRRGEGRGEGVKRREFCIAEYQILEMEICPKATLKARRRLICEISKCYRGGYSWIYRTDF